MTLPTIIVDGEHITDAELLELERNGLRPILRYPAPPQVMVRRPPGVRLVDGELLYSSEWLNVTRERQLSVVREGDET